MPKPDCSELQRTIAMLALNVGSRPGVKGIDDVVAALRADIPELTREEVVGSINAASQGHSQALTDSQKVVADLRREAKSDAGLRAKINTLTSHLAEGTVPAKATRADRSTEAVKALRDISAYIGREVQKSEPAVKARLLKQIDTLTERLESTAGAPPEAKAAATSSPELERLAYQRDRLRGQIRQRIDAMRPKSFWTHAAEPLNASRAVMTSADLSAVLRQGGFIALSHPVRAAQSVPAMLKAFGSPAKSHAINESILNRPNAPLYARHGLYIAPADELTSKLSAMEENFMSRLAGKIPGVGASQRAYATFLNKLRADSFDAMLETLTRNGEATAKEADAIANYINVATGRGSLGKFEPASTFLNTVLFAPKYLASRFQLLGGQPLYGGSMRTRKLIAAEYGRYLAGLGVVYTLGHLAGADIETDPRSSDFGKLRFGNTRVDPLSGLAQVSTFASRVATGKNKPESGGHADTVVDNRKQTPWTIMRFARTKLAPAIGTAIDVATGENIVGEPVTPASAAANLVTPISFREIYDAMRERGVPEGAAFGILSLFGMGLQHYGDEPKPMKSP